MKMAMNLITIIGGIGLAAIGPFMLWWGIVEIKEEGPNVGVVTITLLAALLCLFEGAALMDWFMWVAK